ncbi:MAG: hypothetical protein JXN59_08245 [Anaerolineae bacterium]|nr:hypothetical protein [Anaerolineae bacterium]
MREFAYKVCAAMAESEDDSSYLDWKIVDGFARFLIVVAKAQAEYLSNDFEPPDENPVDKQVAPE